MPNTKGSIYRNLQRNTSLKPAHNDKHHDGRRRSEENLQLEDCEGPLPDQSMDLKSSEPRHHENVDQNREIICTDRAELIERIKRGESPTWLPNRALQDEYLRTNGELHVLPNPPKEVKHPSPLLPAPELSGEKQDFASHNPLSPPIEIKRPRSALHAGDFTEDPVSGASTRQDSPQATRSFNHSQIDKSLERSEVDPWHSLSSQSLDVGPSLPLDLHGGAVEFAQRRSTRDRAPSLITFSSSSYVLKPPTTPLVQQSNNTDLDFSSRDRSISPDKSRRHTLPPHALRDWHPSPTDSSRSYQAQPATYRRGTYHSQGHQSRRSLTSNWSLQPSTSPPTPAFLRSRGTSFSSEASPRQHASMVGSYEESILRGWMSTAPSKPLEFTAKIGVLGKGNCKPRCPAHVTVPFPAVFYSWGASNGENSVTDEPSPYVGHIDLQHSLPTPKFKEEHIGQCDGFVQEKGPDSLAAHDIDGDDMRFHSSTGSRKKRRTTLTPESPGGSYRIPQQGQLQIIIKNPNKTAVKLFLVPYDLSGMEAGTKTFLRQRCFSTDPIIDDSTVTKPVNPLSRLPDHRKPALRYLIHLNICSPTKGRYYLYHQIRVVFANRVPDNKEHLKTEVHVPEPKYSIWKSSKESDSGRSLSAGSKLAGDKASWRRSSGLDYGDVLTKPYSKTFSPAAPSPSFRSGVVPPVPPIPFNLPVLSQRPVMASNDDHDGPMDTEDSRTAIASDVQSWTSDTASRLSPLQRSSSLKSSSSQGSDGYGKLSKGEAGYGGVFGRCGTPEPSEGLLAMRLKRLATTKPERGTEGEV